MLNSPETPSAGEAPGTVTGRRCLQAALRPATATRSAESTASSTRGMSYASLCRTSRTARVWSISAGSAPRAPRAAPQLTKLLRLSSNHATGPLPSDGLEAQRLATRIFPPHRHNTPFSPSISRRIEHLNPYAATMAGELRGPGALEIGWGWRQTGNISPFAPKPLAPSFAYGSHGWSQPPSKHESALG